MSVEGTDVAKMHGTPHAGRWLPRGATGWWALGVSILALAAWVVFPQFTEAFRETYPITDSWVMPTIAVFVTDTAALLNALCIWRWKERSWLVIVATILTIPWAIFATFMVVGDALAGV